MLTDIYVTKAQAAAILNVDSLTIWRWVKDGKLNAEKVGREVLIRREDLSTVTRSNRGRRAKCQI